MRWHRVATAEEAASAEPWLAVTAGGQAVVLASLDGTWFGVEDRCSHAGCAFSEDATLEDETIVCNCHGSEFDLRSGAVRRGPARVPVRSYAVRLSSSAIEVKA